MKLYSAFLTGPSSAKVRLPPAEFRSIRAPYDRPVRQGSDDEQAAGVPAMAGQDHACSDRRCLEKARTGPSDDPQRRGLQGANPGR